MSTSPKRRRRIDTAGALALLAAGIVGLATVSLLAWFAAGIDLNAVPGFGIPCPFSALTGWSCPGCGMTRAIVLAGQLQWSEAWRMNPLLLPLLALCIAGAAARPRRAALRASAA